MKTPFGHTSAPLQPGEGLRMGMFVLTSSLSYR
jgi:hypothetical protein